jgi:hypothetical protein
LAIMNSEILACEVSLLCQQPGDYEWMRYIGVTHAFIITLFSP